MLTYRDGLADVVAKLKFPEGVGRDPYSARTFVRIDGLWKSMGEDRLPSVADAEKRFDRIKDNLWHSYVEILDGIKTRQAGDAAQAAKTLRPDRPGPAAGNQRREGRPDGPHRMGLHARRPRHHRAKIASNGATSRKTKTATAPFATSSKPRSGAKTW